MSELAEMPSISEGDLPPWFPKGENHVKKPKELLKLLDQLGQECLRVGHEVPTRIFYFVREDGIGIVPQPPGSPDDVADDVFTKVGEGVHAIAYGVMASTWISLNPGKFTRASEDPDKKSALFAVVKDGKKLRGVGYTYSVDYSKEHGEEGYIFDVEEIDMGKGAQLKTGGNTMFSFLEKLG